MNTNELSFRVAMDGIASDILDAYREASRWSRANQPRQGFTPSEFTAALNVLWRNLPRWAFTPTRHGIERDTERIE